MRLRKCLKSNWTHAELVLSFRKKRMNKRFGSFREIKKIIVFLIEPTKQIWRFKIITTILKNYWTNDFLTNFWKNYSFLRTNDYINWTIFLNKRFYWTTVQWEWTIFLKTNKITNDERTKKNPKVPISNELTALILWKPV